MEYKVSQFNRVLKHNDEKYLFNARTCALAQLDDQELLVINHPELIQENQKELLDQLIFGGFYIRSDIDELRLIQSELNRSKYHTDGLTLTIAPTADCNFRCRYCYEKDQLIHKSMTDETAKKLVEFIKGYKDQINFLNICWYGGEPLLEIDRIDELSQILIPWCKENNIDYHASMVSNGYLLTKETVSKLKECQIQWIQVTLDGAKETHDQRRILAGGQGTFEKITGNLKQFARDLPTITLRVNIDRSNLNSFHEIKSWIIQEKLEDSIFPYPGQVQAINGCYAKEQCLSNCEFSELEMQINEHESPESCYPSRVFSNCQADSYADLVIGCDGTFYKCWDDIGQPSQAVGSLDEGIDVNSTFLAYLTMDATQDPECSNCFYLPLCMGGCPKQYQAEKSCSRHRYYLDEKIKKYIEAYSVKNKKDENQEASTPDDQERL